MWDCVKKDSKPKFIVEGNQVRLNAERKFLPGYEAPTVACESVSLIRSEKFKNTIFLILKVFGHVVIAYGNSSIDQNSLCLLSTAAEKKTGRPNGEDTNGMEKRNDGI